MKHLMMVALLSFASVSTYASTHSDDAVVTRSACMVNIGTVAKPQYLNVLYIRNMQLKDNTLVIDMASNYSNADYFEVPYATLADAQRGIQSLAKVINTCR